MKMQFCPYCGTKLDEGACFCKKCGEAIISDAHDTQKIYQEQPFEKKENERKTVYEGCIHKCPNCGAVLESFLAICPTCGYEIRDVSSASSVREFALKLEAVSAQKMPAFEEKKSVMKMIFGKDFKGEDEAEEARRQFENQKNEEKASLIINFPVPNSKEDIFEFMTLASSNIDVKKGLEDVISKAWLSKMEQVYQRAEITMNESPDFIQIKNIYDCKKNEIKKKKIKGFLISAGSVVVWFFLVGLLWNPVVTIGIAIAILFIGILGIVLFKKR